MPRILLVDDDEPLRTLLRLVLVHMGYEVVEASNGKEAVKLLQPAPPDLVLTDIVMPEQEGLETITVVRRLHPAMKIIAMSGCGRIKAIDYLKIAKMMGADRVLAKPFSNAELTLALDELLGAG